MDYKFLHKVVDQIISETIISYGMRRIQFPFSTSRFLSYFSIGTYSSTLFPLFSRHCRDIYGLNDDEIQYVWEEYKDDIRFKVGDKLKNNG